MSDSQFATVPFAEALLRGARRHSDRDCIVLPDERATYGQLALRSNHAAKALIGLGVDRGDRVGILMANCLDYVDILFGASLIGAIPVLYNARFKAREIAHVTHDADVAVIVTNDIVEQHTDYVELLQRSLPELGSDSQGRGPTVVCLGTGPRPGFVGRSQFDEGAASVTDGEIERRHGATRIESIAAMFYTSGTTAMPKGCPLSHIVLQHAGVVGGLERFGLVEGDVLWGPLPMFHTAFAQPLTGILHVGGTYLSMTHFDPAVALHQIAAEQATMMFPAFPTISLQLLNDPGYTADSFASVRTIINVGPHDVLTDMQNRMPHTRQITVFGMTETGGSVAMGDPSESLAMRTQSSGPALPGDEIMVVDPDTGRVLGPDERGEIMVRGRGVFSGYHNDPANNAETFDDDGWFHTGDLGSLDTAGRLTFHGRLKDMLKVGGENVACVEVEGYLATHPAVNLAQVVGIPDQKYEEVPVAFVERRPGEQVTEDDIISFCRDEIASFKVPRHVRFVNEWPMGATKILKYELRDRICRELGLT